MVEPARGAPERLTDEIAENFPVLLGREDGNPVVLATSGWFTGLGQLPCA